MQIFYFFFIYPSFYDAKYMTGDLKMNISQGENYLFRKIKPQIHRSKVKNKLPQIFSAMYIRFKTKQSN